MLQSRVQLHLRVLHLRGDARARPVRVRLHDGAVPARRVLGQGHVQGPEGARHGEAHADGSRSCELGLEVLVIKEMGKNPYAKLLLMVKFKLSKSIISGYN